MRQSASFSDRSPAMIAPTHPISPLRQRMIDDMRMRQLSPKTQHQYLRAVRQCEWVVYAKRPFAGPEAVLAYLSRYTHRVAISNSRLVAMDEHGITFRWKDYRSKGRTRRKTMTLDAQEFMRRFLLHV